MRGRDMPLVSVAVLCYNQREYVGDCLDSVLAQDYANVLIVVADDGSTDGTVEILSSYRDRNPGRVVLALSERNRGITRNSLAAFQRVQGKYTAWIGGDDLMFEGKLSTQVARMESDPRLAMCYHDLQLIDAQGRDLGTTWSQGRKCPDGDVHDLARLGTFNGGSATMVRNVATPRHGFDPRVRDASDWMHWVETVYPHGRISYIPQTLGAYRRHRRSVTSQSLSGRGHELVVDHLISIAIMRERYPALARDLRAREAQLLLSLAEGPDGRFDLARVRASLNTKTTTKALLVEISERIRPGLFRAARTRLATRGRSPHATHSRYGG